MIFYIVLTCLFSTIEYGKSESLMQNSRTNENTLVLVSALFRHGDRTPVKESLWKSNPYYNESFYYPFGYGQLTNPGKRRAFTVGLALRQRYDQFLGKTYNPYIVESRSTNVDRTKMTLELVLAGLFPPSKSLVWLDGYYWQPIPYQIVDQDKELQSTVVCPTFDAEYSKLLKTPKVKSMDAANLWLYDYLSKKIHINVTSMEFIVGIYSALETQRLFGLPLEEWAILVYPEPLRRISVEYMYTIYNTTNLRRIGAGYFLRKIISDVSKKINGILEPSQRKLFLYSAHDYNIGGLLISLDVYRPKIPPFASYVLMELHKINGEYGIKLLHQDYSTLEPKVLVLPGCQEFCPFNRFVNLVSKYIPTDQECYK